MAASTPTADPTIRFATEEGKYSFPTSLPHSNLPDELPPADVPTILALIHELAAYEKASSSVLATSATLLSTLSFPSNPNKGYAKTLLIYPPPSSPENEQETQAPCAGMALYYPSYSTWRAAPGIFLEDLFIRPEFRGRGYGTRLLRRLAVETKKMGGGRLEWSVLKWNEPSLRFYEGVGIGAVRLEEWVGMRVEGKRLGRLAGEGGEVGGEVGRKVWMEEEEGV